jgi:hypothetical protein
VSLTPPLLTPEATRQHAGMDVCDEDHNAAETAFSSETRGYVVQKLG